MTTAMPAMPDAPDPRREARTSLALCLLCASAWLLGPGLYLLIRAWVGAVAH